MKPPLIVEWQKLSRAIADVQTALADAFPEWFNRLTNADTTIRRWADARRKYADRVELAWLAETRGEFGPWDSLFKQEDQ